MQDKEGSLDHVGWQEWCTLPELGIPAIKAKIDTGAKTSAIHATHIETFSQHGRPYIRFIVYPLQRNVEIQKECVAEVADRRSVMSSNGLQEERYVIKTQLKIGARSWEIELTLSDRDPLRYRLLLGREALRAKVLVDPEKKCCLSKIGSKEINELYYHNHPKALDKKHAEF